MKTSPFDEIADERAKQVAAFGTADDALSLGEWAALISHYATRHVAGDLRGINVAKFREDMVKVGALAVAAVDAIDRKAASREPPGFQTAQQGVR